MGEGPHALWHVSEDPTIEPGFEPGEVGGYWTTSATVEPLEQVEMTDLIGAHLDARIELRFTPSIWVWWRAVASSTLEFSGSRLRNASEHPARFGV